MKRLSIILVILLSVIAYTSINSRKEVRSEIQLSQSQQVEDINEDEAKIKNGTYCFQYSIESKDLLDSRDVKLVVENGNITGTKSGSNQTSEYSVGYTGEMIGSIKGNIVNVVSSLNISDGGVVKSEERYELKENSLVEMRYRYKEDFSANILRIDESFPDNGQGESFPMKTTYKKVSCL